MKCWPRSRGLSLQVGFSGISGRMLLIVSQHWTGWPICHVRQQAAMLLKGIRPASTFLLGCTFFLRGPLTWTISPQDQSVPGLLEQCGTMPLSAGGLGPSPKALGVKAFAFREYSGKSCHAGIYLTKSNLKMQQVILQFSYFFDFSLK